MTAEEKLEVRKYYAAARYAITKAMPIDISDEIIQAVWAKLIASLAADLANWATE